MFYQDTYRQVFEQWVELGNSLQNLRSIVQNDVPLTTVDISNYIRMFNDFNRKLHLLHQSTLGAISRLNPVFEKREEERS